MNYLYGNSIISENILVQRIKQKLHYHPAKSSEMVPKPLFEIVVRRFAFISSILAAVCGIPQGNILGPLMYSVYIADFPPLMANKSGSI